VAETLSAQDQVVIEVTANSWHLYDMLVEYAGTVIVASFWCESTLCS
jgi:hypothetical protein